MYIHNKNMNVLNYRSIIKITYNFSLLDGLFTGVKSYNFVGVFKCTKREQVKRLMKLKILLLYILFPISIAN